MPRPLSFDPDRLKKELENGASALEAAELLGISRRTVDRWLAANVVEMLSLGLLRSPLAPSLVPFIRARSARAHRAQAQPPKGT